MSSSESLSSWRKYRRFAGLSLSPSGIQRLLKQVEPCTLPISAAMVRQLLAWRIQNSRTFLSGEDSDSPSFIMGCAKNEPLKSSAQLFCLPQFIQPEKSSGVRLSRETGVFGSA